MRKVQVAQRFDRTESCNRWQPVVNPIIYSIHQRIEADSPKSVAKNIEDSEAKNEQNSNRHHFARYLSVAIHIVAMSVLLYMIFLDTNTFINHPTATNVEDEMYEIKKVDFPGVAICNMNIISREAVNRLVEKIWAQDDVRAIGNMTRKKVLRLMKYLGHLISFGNEESEPGDIMLCDKILRITLKKNNIIKDMQDLAPQCGSFMRDCAWRGAFRMCHELFVQRWTQDGYCCTFNYVRWADRISSQQDTDFRIEVERSRIPGETFGLAVHLRPDINDKFYSILPGNGFKVLIYKASDYPDSPSGRLKEVIISPGSENVITLGATSFYSTPDVLQYDKKRRNCLFSTELFEIYNGFYSYSQCNMLCRVRNMYAICGCIPFFYPIPADIDDARKCLLSDLTCLAINKYKWWTVTPSEYNDLDDNYYKATGESESNTTSGCNCLPSCESIYYSIRKAASPITNYRPKNTNGLGKQDTRDDTRVVVNFQATSVQRLRQDVVYQWYDLLSNYGGLCSLFLGISIITPIEFTYLFCARLWSRWRKNHRVQKQRLLSAAPAEKALRERPIYWNEIIPLERKVINPPRSPGVKMTPLATLS